jgi:hypothetical protein
MSRWNWASASDLLQKERSNPLAIERALRLAPDARVGEEIGDVVPQPQLGVVAVGMLKTFDRREGFDALSQRVESIESLLKERKVRVGTADDDGRGACGGNGECDERATTNHEPPTTNRSIRQATGTAPCGRPGR